MSKKIKYTNEPIHAKIIKDFLPPPSELVLKNDSLKVTLALSRRSIDFFKRQAKKRQSGYQTMIRNLLDQYTDHFGGR
jgi:predicted DNA binding CopG/RHH family protein